MGRTLGNPTDPLLVSVRSGAKFSMPGMMETVLNVGLNDESVNGLAAASKDERFALDSYRRLVQMFGSTVLGIEGSVFADALDAAKRARGTEEDLDLDEEDLRALVATYKELVREHAGRDFPQEPREQLDLAVRAVFDSWNTERAVLYRRQERIPEDLGTAVNVQAMVFGNRGMDSGSGVAFTRDPASGAQGEYGDYLQNAQGEDVVAGIRNTVSLADMQDVAPGPHAELLRIMATLEHHYRDMCDIEFTVENDKLWMLQTRVGKRTPEAAFRIAVHMADEGLIDMDEALRRVNGEQLAQLMFPRFDSSAPRELLATGHERLARRRRRQDRLRHPDRGRVGRARGERDPGPPGDQPRRPARDDGRPRRAHQPGRQDLARRRGGPRDGPHLCLRGGGAARRRRAQAARRTPGADAARGRRDLDRRHHRRGVRRRGAGRRLAGGPALRGRGRRQRPGRLGGPDHGARGRRPPAARAHQRRQGRRRRPGPPVRRRGDRAVPHRAHVPRRAAPARREPRGRRGRGRPGGGAVRAAAAAARRLHRDPRVDGRAAGDDPADRPAAARVPPRLHRPVGAGGAGGRAATTRTAATTSSSRRSAGCTSRTRCSGCAASASAS